MVATISQSGRPTWNPRELLGRPLNPQELLSALGLLRYRRRSLSLFPDVLPATVALSVSGFAPIAPDAFRCVPAHGARVPNVPFPSVRVRGVPVRGAPARGVPAHSAPC